MLVLCILFAVGVCAIEVENDIVGERPIEMIWVNRTEDTRPPLVDFEDMTRWTAQTTDVEARFIQSREQQIWGRYVGKLVYKVTGSNPSVILRPARPIRIEQPIDCANIWTYGPGKGVYGPTSRVGIYVHLRLPDGGRLRLRIGNASFNYWNLLHRRFSKKEAVRLTGGAALEAIEFHNLGEENPWYFDNLSLYKEEMKPLKFVPRPKRGVDPFPGQSPGLNTGRGRLPFPTREETVLPENYTERFKTTIDKKQDAFVFRYSGDDGELEYRYVPKTGTLDDISVQWQGRSKAFRPMSTGGVYFETPGGQLAPRRMELLSCDKQKDKVISRWKATLGAQTAEVTYTLRLWQKSLVVDVKCPGGEVAQFRTGKTVGARNPRLVRVPYLWYWHGRPAVLLTGPSDSPLFVQAFIDWYRTNSSEIWAGNPAARNRVASYECGTSYNPKTDGTRNDCFERVFLTVSPRFEEVLPTVANPKSPWMDVTGTRLYRNNGFCSNREGPEAYLQRWKDVAGYGIREIILTNHESGWSDYWYESSHTLRTRAARLKGGNEAALELTRKIKDIGYRYGFYTNYADYLPQNEYWDEDYTLRTVNNEWWGAGGRNYILKPSRAVELSEKLPPIIKEKFEINTGYCDVHTATATFAYVDYDARVPGAGTLAATFYAYGEVLLNEKRGYNGPIQSEGPYHWMYAGLTDGDYARQEQRELWKEPWLVDFDLRKLHPLSVNIGMGNLFMYLSDDGVGHTPQQREEKLDWFLAATIAYGHGGWLEQFEGPRGMVRSYYMLQQLQSRYTRELAEEIKYADSSGELLDTSSAIATGVYKRSQVFIRYSNGLKVWVNGNTTEDWRIPAGLLPPHGWHAESEDGSFLEYSAMKDGHRADYVKCPEYYYADGRGTFTRFDNLATDGALTALLNKDGTVELIPVGCTEWFGVSLDGRTATATALDRERNSLGVCEVRFARGMVYVVPKPGAFSYVLKPAQFVIKSPACDVEEVTPGQAVTIKSKRNHTFQVPAEAKPGNRLWNRVEDKWIDFTVVPIASVNIRPGIDNTLDLKVTSRLFSKARFVAEMEGQSKVLSLGPGQAGKLSFTTKLPDREELRAAKLSLTAGEARQLHTWWLHAKRVRPGKNTFEYSVHNSKDDIKCQPPRYFIPGLKVADLKSARAGWLRMEVVGGISHEDVEVEINGTKIGYLPISPSYFSEIRDEFFSPIYIQLPSNAIAALGAENRIVLYNRGMCVYKVRDFWIELELADGRRFSSRITAPVKTQPPGYFFDSDMYYPTNPNLIGPTRTEVTFPLED